MDIEKNISSIVDWIKEKVEKAGGKGVVFGLSGGVDSAVAAGLAKLAYPNSSLGIIMPCHSNPQDEKDAKLVANTLELKIEKVNLTSVYDQLLENIEVRNNNMALANIKPRLRMTTLYYYAQINNYLVLGPSNKSEFEIGYFTKHGDSGVDLLPLASILKRDVWEMARLLNIPKEIITKAPSAGLWEDQTDEEEMGFGYDILDTYLDEKTGPRDLTSKIDKMNKTSEHKRNYPSIYYPKEIHDWIILFNWL